MNLYLIVSVIVFFILGMIWKKNCFLDVITKIILVGLSIIGLILWLELNGYLIHVIK